MIEVEKYGVPTVSLVTIPFVEDASLTARIFGMPNLPRLILGASTITNLNKEEIHKVCDASTQLVLDGLFKRPVEEEAPPPEEEIEAEYRLETFSGEDSLQAWEEFNRRFLKEGWGDGFPLIAPTEEKVEQMIKASNRDPNEVITVLEPGMGLATVKIVAINAVMAGCVPEHLPVLIAALKAMSAPMFRLRTVAVSTGPHTPILVVNGPIAKELGINSGRGLLGPGKESCVNTVIGRAVRLILMNVGHCYIGSLDLDTQGSPNKYSMCIAENEEASPWEPYHVAAGYHKDENTVTVFGVESQFEVFDLNSDTPEGILNSYAWTMNSIGAYSTRTWLIPRRRCDSIILISPDHAKAIAKAGWEKEDVQAYLHAKSQLPAWIYKNTVVAGRIKPGCRWILDAPDDMLLPIAASPTWFNVVVAGGAAGKSSFISGVGKAITEKIEL